MHDRCIQPTVFYITCHDAQRDGHYCVSCPEYREYAEKRDTKRNSKELFAFRGRTSVRRSEGSHDFIEERTDFPGRGGAVVGHDGEDDGSGIYS